MPALCAKLLAWNTFVVRAVLPPGHEDELYCPSGYCKRRKDMPMGFVGPASSFWECATEGGDQELLGVTPWGANHGEEKRKELLDRGFHSRLCEDPSEGPAESTAQAEPGPAEPADEIPERETLPAAQEFSAGLGVWSVIIGAFAVAWWYSSREGGQVSGASAAVPSQRAGRPSDADLRRRRLEALSRSTSEPHAPTATSASKESMQPRGLPATESSHATDGVAAAGVASTRVEVAKAGAEVPEDAEPKGQRAATVPVEPDTSPIFAVKVRGTLAGVQTAKSVPGLQAMTTVEELSDSIRKEFDSKDAKLRVFFNGKELKATATLGKLGIKAGSSLQAMFITNSATATTAAVTATTAAVTATTVAVTAHSPTAFDAAPTQSSQSTPVVPSVPELDGSPPSVVRAQGTFKGILKSFDIDGLAGSLSVLSLEQRIAEAFESGVDYRLRLFYMGRELKDAAASLSSLNMKNGSTVQVMFKQGEAPRALPNFAQVAAAAGTDQSTTGAVLAAAEAAGCNPSAVFGAAPPQPVSREEAWRALAELEAQLRRAVDPNEDATSRQAATVLKQLLTTLTHNSNPALMQMAQASVPDLAKIWGCEATREWLIKTLNPDGSNSGLASSSGSGGSSS